MYIHVYTPPKLHAQSFINLQKLVKPINCQQNFSVLSSPQKLVYGRLASKNFRTLNIVYSLHMVKFCLEFLLFPFFCGHHFLAKYIINRQKLQKLLYVRKIFIKSSQIFLLEIPRFFLPEAPVYIHVKCPTHKTSLHRRIRFLAATYLPFFEN